MARSAQGSAAGTAAAGGRAADLWAGLAAAAVVLPQAMAFGVALFAPVGLDVAGGAVAGLVAAAALSIFSGLSGATLGLISAPTGPTLVLLAGAVSQMARAGLEGETLLTGLVALVVGAGVLQAAIGLSGGGRLIKFMPFPVVAGFMTGSAVLMVLSQVQPASGAGAEADWLAWRWLPGATALVTFVVVRLTRHVLPAVPGTVAGLVLGSAFFQVAVLFGPGAAPEAWVIGSLPGPESLHIGLDPGALRALPWQIIAPSALALAVLASLDTLLTSVIADVTTGVRHDARRELVGQGIGHVVGGLLGGLAGAGTTGATVVAARSGGRRWVGCATGTCFAALVLVGRDVGALLPVSALAGIIFSVAVGMVETDLLAWLRHRQTRADAVVALLVTAVTVALDLMVAVGLGVAIAVVLFVRAQVQAPIVHRRSTAVDRRSLRQRPDAHRALLDQHGDRIVVYNLRGRLFFGTADRLFDELSADLDRPAWVILQMRRVHQVDLSAARILQQIADRLDAHGGRLVFCEVHKRAGVGRKVKRGIRRIHVRKATVRVKTFVGVDEALEYAEDALLTALGTSPDRHQAQVPPEQMDFCRDLQPADRDAFLETLAVRKLKKGETLFRAGEHGDTLYLIERGEVDARIPTGRHHYRRAAKYGPGTLFGAIAFLEPGPRAADVVAVRSSRLLELPRERFNALAATHPTAGVAILEALARAQSRNLRWSAAEVSRLAQW